MRHTTTFVFIAIIVGFGTWGIFAWRASTNAHAQNTLCSVLYTIIARNDHALGRKGSSSFDFFQGHPDRLRLAHRENRRILDDLPCRP